MAEPSYTVRPAKSGDALLLECGACGLGYRLPTPIPFSVLDGILLSWPESHSRVCPCRNPTTATTDTP